MKLFLINGFLGSGKTTAIKQACIEILKRNVNVAVITNDQGDDLVDSAFIKSFGISAEEVPGGCFCCNFQQLTERITSLQDRDHPEVIFAESVGSCTDLIATVAKPLAGIYPEVDVVLSVFVDASLMSGIINGSASFLNENVRYIYKKQIEEADILIVNKIDLLSRIEMDKVLEVINSEYPDKIILCQNSLEQWHIMQWLQYLDQFSANSDRSSLEMDYDVYARGESMLAWLDQSLEIFTSDQTAYMYALELIDKIKTDIRDHNYTIGHLKFLIDDGITQQKISHTTINTDDSTGIVNPPKANTVSVLINARVQTEPNQLKDVVDKAIKAISDKSDNQILVKKFSSFQPGYPKPTHRIVN